MKQFLEKNQVLRYIIVSIPTMLVGFGLYLTLTRLVGMRENPANFIATFCAIVAAYFSNKLLVFHTPFTTMGAFVREFTAHMASRAAMVVVELGGFYLLCTVWGWRDLPTKLLIAIIITLLNYSIGKLVVFRNIRRFQ